MAGAMARGWAAGGRRPGDAVLRPRARARGGAGEEVGGETRESLSELRDDSDLVVLAVKPAALDNVATELDPAPALLSVMAATTVAKLATPSRCPHRQRDAQPAGGGAARRPASWSPEDMDEDLSNELIAACSARSAAVS